ncbi:unnamed protein product [Camellia sinensis]
MAQLFLSFLFLLLSISCLASPARSTDHMNPQSPARAFIEAECQATHYPQLCIQCLSNYANNATVQSPKQLAQFTLKVSLIRALHAQAYVLKVAAQMKAAKAQEYQAVKDCLDQISDGVGQLSQSIKELQKINQEGEANFIWHMSNVQTWLSTALTDATTCIDGVSGRAIGGRVKAMIKAKVLNVAQFTSNALALFNRFAAKHRAAGATTKP